ncbi:hypothetical protein PV726_32430 [Streptomyces europaeiscabiei]|uniref:hypothetical protein n=1 Tax=Streptomyces europaeiscabiei TaxID=146819 RepID=UPI00299FFAEA|nr:hypothetical protein [Streptomyces europaeiscabiei]MDX3694965.1 hypothetical protein [Streptomyces europaeiscabiei]
MDRPPSERFNPEIDECGFYAERIVFTTGREGRTRIFTGAKVREQIDQMTYTDNGEDWMYTSITQNPATRVITGATTTSPTKDAHHTATWAPITAEEKDAFQKARAAQWEKLWETLASVGA